MQPDSTQGFYDDLSADYHLIFNNWDDAIKNQSATLDRIIKKYSKNPAKTLLDCSCGIGTQAIGLACMGYKVSASDLSPLSIERARLEALKRKADIAFQIADLLQLENQVKGTFDVVISCDNSLPHLLNNEDLSNAAKNILLKIKPGGLFIASVRDYDAILKEKPLSTYPVVTHFDKGKNYSLQIWDWTDINHYTVSHLTISGTTDYYSTKIRKVKYRAYTRIEITQVLQYQGFLDIAWLMPEQSGYYQPIIVAHRS